MLRQPQPRLGSPDLLSHISPPADASLGSERRSLLQASLYTRLCVLTRLIGRL